MLSIPGVPVTAGGFTLQLDFGAAAFPDALNGRNLQQKSWRNIVFVEP